MYLSEYIEKYTFDTVKEKRIFINGEETDYSILSNGIVISYKNKKPIIFKGGLDKNGYHIVTLHHNKKLYTRKVHRLVAEAFIPNPENYTDVNHKDGNKLNNDVSNLGWCESWKNTHHACEKGLREKVNFEESIRIVCELLESNLYDIKYISNLTGVKRSTIYKILRKEGWVHVSSEYNIDNYDKSKHINFKKKQSKKLKDDTIIKICIELENNNLSISDISKKYNVPSHTIRRILNHKYYTNISNNYSIDNYTKRINQFK